MSHLENRNNIIERIRKELIGPGSDEFFCGPDYSNEIIEVKPLQRYYSGILFPRQTQEDGEDNSPNLFTQEKEEPEILNEPSIENLAGEEAEKVEFEEDKDEDSDTVSKTNSNAFFPSHFGLSFCTSKECKDFQIHISFGNYKKAKVNEIMLPYNGSDINLLHEFGLDQFVMFDEGNKTLKMIKEIKRTENSKITEDYILMQAGFKAMSVNHRRSGLFKHLQKLFFKDKYKRFENEILVGVTIKQLLEEDDFHLKLKLAEIPGVSTENWHKDSIGNLIVHIKLYQPDPPNKYFIKVVLENTYAHKKDQFSLSKEKLNRLALFQTEIKVETEHFVPFKDYHSHLYKTEEDRMLDYLFRNKLAYGIGHGSACTWDNCEQDLIKPIWIKTTYVPQYSVKSQSTETDKIASHILDVKSLSSLSGTNKNETIEKLQVVADAYLDWIKEESKISDENEYGKINLEKCITIYNRINSGIRLLKENDKAYESFRLANTAIYIQMFQTEWHFNKKDGYEVFERDNELQYSYESYKLSKFPNGKKEPSWRPFQLAFILQTIPGFVDEKSSDRDLVDLLYFPTGGGKTEAYLAVSAFLIFWRRLNHKEDYDGVNIIIRYTLRLLSAQQFERATKLILACEFIREQNKNLGENRISIGFWIGKATVPNNIIDATYKFNKLLKRLNTPKFDGKKAINPFQLTNCQWCNTKVISRVNEKDLIYSVGHRISKHLTSYCLNPKCCFNETKEGLPIVLIDDDIYHRPPTILFATVDKFASLAWKEESTNLFKYKNNRPPELIIQDELHLLNGPLGSLVGLFENVIISLCSNKNQKPKIIASTATVKNVEAQILGLYGRPAQIFPQYGTNADDTFFSKTTDGSKRRYLGILPTGKTSVMTNLQLLSALFFGRLEVFENVPDKTDADQFWTILSYYKSLKEIGRFSNKISSELKASVQQMQVRHLKNFGDYPYNYWRLPYRNLELTSRIPNERIKKNLDKLDIGFNGSLKERQAYDFVLATNMISVGLDVSRLGIMVMNGMPPNTAEYIQASSRVARKNEGVVVTMFDPFSTRDLSYFEDFVQFHKTFYKQVEPLSVTPFANSALDKMLFTIMVTYFRHKMGQSSNDMANKLAQPNLKIQLHSEIKELFEKHPFIGQEFPNVLKKIDGMIQAWQYKIDSATNLKFSWPKHSKESLMKPIHEKTDSGDILVAMQSMRSVEPSAEILIKQQ